MIDVVSTTKTKFTRTNAGVLRIEGTRVSLDSVILAFNQGATPEQIVQDYDSLTLGQVYAAISNYLQNRDEVDAYLAGRAVRREELRSEHNQTGIRKRLLARRVKVA